MDLNFEIFMIALLVLSILVVGNFLRDGESNYLEGALLVVCFWIQHPSVLGELNHADFEQIVYGIIAVSTWFYPNPDVATSNGLDCINILLAAAKASNGTTEVHTSH